MKRLLCISAISLSILLGCTTTNSRDPRPPLIDDSPFTDRVPALVTNEFSRTNNYMEDGSCF